MHLVKTYCLPAVMYGCETWSFTAFTLKSLSLVWNNVFRKIFNACWRESPRSLQLYCVCLSISFLLHQCRLIFWKRLITSNNTLLAVLAKLSQPQIVAFASNYGIVQLLSCSVNCIKRHILSTISHTV